MKNHSLPLITMIVALALCFGQVYAQNKSRFINKENYTFGQCRINMEAKADFQKIKDLSAIVESSAIYFYPLVTPMLKFRIEPKGAEDLDAWFNFSCQTGLSQDEINATLVHQDEYGTGARVWGKDRTLAMRNSNPMFGYEEIHVQETRVQTIHVFEISGSNWRGELVRWEDYPVPPYYFPPPKDKYSEAFTFCIRQNDGLQVICGQVGTAYSFDPDSRLNRVIAAFKIISFDTTFVPVSPSFDCAKNPSQSEKIICANAILSKYDVVLGQNYKNIKERLEADNQKTLAAGQRAWIKQRNACETMRYSSKTLKCLTDAYIHRIDELCTTYADVPACTRAAAIQLP